MKKIFIVLFVCILISPLSLSAQKITLGWQARDPDIDGYVLYYSQNRQRLPIGKVTTYTITLDPNQNWYFMITAIKNGLESDFSNEAATAQERPASPARLEILEEK